MITALLLIVLCSLSTPAAAAPDPVPVCRLAVSFDTAAHTMNGMATITVPPEAPLSIALGPLTLRGATLDGAPLAATADNTIILDAAPSPRTLVIHYQAAADSEDDINADGIAMTGFWHPRLDQPCRYSLQATVPKGMRGVSEADSITTLPGAENVVSTRFDHPVAAIHFIAGPYKVGRTALAGGGEVVSYFFAEDAELAARYREKAAGYIERYSKLIGPYPYQRFSIVENRRPTGYAMPTFTLLGSAVVRLPFIVDTSLGHEVLHSWFGNAVAVGAGGNWCEGLTTYLADQAYAADKGEGVAFRKNEILKYQSYIHADNAKAVTAFTGADLERGPAALANRALGYGKVAMIFHDLRRRLGDDAFFTALRAFFRDHNGGTATWDDIKAAFRATGGKEIEPLFDQWLERDDIPALTARDFEITEEDGHPQLRLTLIQKTKEPYDLEIPLTVTTDAGTVRRVVHARNKETPVSFTLDAAPRLFTIDPDYDLMRTLVADEIPPSWSWFKGAENKLAVVNSAAEYDLYQPLIDHLEAMGTEILAADEITDQELTGRAVIFLGTSGRIPRSLFAKVGHPATGLTIDVRRNPLNPELPMVLATAAGRAEISAALPRLSHYGRYGYLHFEGGRTTDKARREAENGMIYSFGGPPLGVETARALDLDHIIRRLRYDRVVYVGEAHTRYADHQLQLAVIRGLANQGRRVAIGMEMFPASKQQALDDYISGAIDETTFLKESEYFTVWSYDFRLYRDILRFARARKIPVIGLNIDKKIVNKVYRQGGAAALAPEELMDLPADRDLDVPGYRQRVEEVFNLHPGGKGADTARMAGFLQAQAIWDETMASNVASYVSAHPDTVMVVIAGRGHILREQAIPLRVKRRIGVSQSVIVSAGGGEFSPAEADYVVFMPPAQLPPRPLMGIVMEPDKEKGVVIKDVKKKSPAAAAGVRAGDRLLAIDGKAVADMNDVRILMLAHKKGDHLKVRVLRPGFFGDRKLELELTL